MNFYFGLFCNLLLVDVLECAENVRSKQQEFKRILLSTRTIAKQPIVKKLFSTDFPNHLPIRSALAWGRKPSSHCAEKYASKHGIAIRYLEDSFLRSYNTGEYSPSLGLVVDEVGIYYDSTKPSSLEKLLNSDLDLLEDLQANVQIASKLIRVHRLSKYNHALDLSVKDIRNTDIQCVLVVDQTVGDLSVSFGEANSLIFIEMLATALAENPLATIYVKSHPEVFSGLKKGFLTHVESNARMVLLRENVNPISLLEKMDKVYVVTSALGFEALLVGKSVVCFGVPWYAGWGVTDDRCVNSSTWARRTRNRSVNELFAAAFIHYSHYLNPVTHKRGSIFDVLNWLIRQREMATLLHGPNRRGRVVVVGFPFWRVFNLKALLGLNIDFVHFVRSVENAKNFVPTQGDTLVCWGAFPPIGLVNLASLRGARLLHLEDGFIRSVGLGSDLIRPQSIVLDELGIYFDATRPSDLEHMLSTREFTSEDVQRAQQVRTFIVDHAITKYNLEPRQTVEYKKNSKLVLLVPGQVEDDASIRLGCTNVCTNLALLNAVREARPDAFIIYKPHPDVLSLNRKGRLALDAACQYADQVAEGVSVVSCIDACDEVHTMTSLAGFDALLRGKKVVTYGQPFYAGWGLTEDRAINATAFERRQRRLSLDELVAGALLHYPIYWDWDLKGYTTCEAVLHRILEQRTALEANGGLHKLRVGYVRRQLRKAKVLVQSLAELF